MWRKRKLQDFHAEIDEHLRVEAERLCEEGVPPAEALAGARRAFGNRTIAEERFYEASRAMWFENLLQDLRYAGRIMRKNPAFSATIVFVLALGTGVNTAVFSVVNAVLINAVPYERPGELFRLFQQPQGKTRMPVAPANYLDWRDQSHSFRHLAAFQTDEFRLEGGGRADKIPGARVSAELFATLGAAAASGRGFVAEEDRPGAPRVAVIGHSLWTTMLASDPNVIGRQVRVNGQDVSVVGVMPPGFAFPSEQSAFWTPLTLGDSNRSRSRTENYLGVIGRLKDGTTARQAQAELDTIAARLSAAYPNSNERLGVAMRSLRDHTVGQVSTALLTLLAAVALVLLIAGANVSNLLLARTAARRREIAVRVSLGAGRARIVRQLLAESILLGLVGGAAGWVLARTSFQLLLQLVPDSVPSPGRIRLDGEVFLYTAAISMIGGIAIGLAPALDATRVRLGGLLQGGRNSPGRTTARLRDALVAAEVALALILLVGCGLMIRSMIGLYSVDPGFNPDHLMAIRVTLGQDPGMAASPEATEARETLAFRELIGRAAALPGVRAVGAISAVPLTNEYTGTRLMVEGRALPATERVPEADYSVVTPGYFQVAQIPLLRGRGFADSDGKNAPAVAVVNEAMARQFFPGEDAVGHRIRRGGRDSDRPWIRIVGVVGNVRHLGLDTPPVPELFFPHGQAAWPQLHLMVRTSVEPASLAASLRRLAAAMGPNHEVGTPRTVEQLLASSVGTRRFAMQLLSLFAFLAFVLAGVGIYGVLSYSVTQRSQEIGIRMALGATAPGVLRMVAAQGALPLAAGIGAGFAGSFALTRVMGSLVYGVTPYDATTFVAAFGLLVLVAITALLAPARRALRTDPLAALRYE